jgi:hypothetical protein
VLFLNCLPASVKVTSVEPVSTNDGDGCAVEPDLNEVGAPLPVPIIPFIENVEGRMVCL